MIFSRSIARGSSDAGRAGASPRRKGCFFLLLSDMHDFLKYLTILSGLFLVGGGSRLQERSLNVNCKDDMPALLSGSALLNKTLNIQIDKYAFSRGGMTPLSAPLSADSCENVKRSSR